MLGSVKTNVGHLEAAAGVAGFIKTVLAVHHGYIPQHLNFEQLTPYAPVGMDCLSVASSGREWPAVDRPRRAGVSSFGVSGSNAHVVIEQAPDVVAPVADSFEPAVSTLVVSGKTVARVKSWATALADWMEGAGAAVGLAAVAHTLNHHRTRHAKFATVCAADRGEAVAGLRAVAAGQPAPGVVLADTSGRDTAPGTEHPPGRHPRLPNTPWHHTHHWISPNTPFDAAAPLGSSGGSTAKPELASSNDEMDSLADLVEASELESATRAEKS